MRTFTQNEPLTDAPGTGGSAARDHESCAGSRRTNFAFGATLTFCLVQKIGQVTLSRGCLFDNSVPED